MATRPAGCMRRLAHGMAFSGSVLCERQTDRPARPTLRERCRPSPSRPAIASPLNRPAYRLVLVARMVQLSVNTLTRFRCSRVPVRHCLVSHGPALFRGPYTYAFANTIVWRLKACLYPGLCFLHPMEGAVVQRTSFEPWSAWWNVNRTRCVFETLYLCSHSFYCMYRFHLRAYLPQARLLEASRVGEA